MKTKSLKSGYQSIQTSSIGQLYDRNLVKLQVELPNNSYDQDGIATVTQTKRLEETRQEKKDKMILKIPMQMVGSKSTASLLFNRSGYEEKMHLHQIYEHKFFDELTVDRRSLEEIKFFKKLSTKRLDTPQGCVLTKRNSLALVPRGVLQRWKDSGTLLTRNARDLDT